MSNRGWFLVALIIAAGTLPPLRGSEDSRARPSHPIVGRWKLVSVEVDGHIAPSLSLPWLFGPEPPVLEFTDGRWSSSITGGRRKAAGTFRLDDSKSPRRIDMKVERVEPAGPEDLPGEGIYKIDGDSLTIAWRSISKDRPADFATVGNPVFVEVYARMK
jgi:uncharacterized protein (TIGR03067 family)